MPFWKLPKNQVIFLLSWLLAAASFRIGLVDTGRIFILCMGFVLFWDTAFIYWKVKKLVMPHSAIVTGLILTLVVDPSATWYQVAGVTGIAMALKNFLRPGGEHIFNPAASGLLAGLFLFGLYPSWWATSLYTPGLVLSFSNLVIIIPILLLSYVSCYRLRRFYLVGAYLIFSLVLWGSNILSIGTIFYAIVMLAEPMTSPNKPKYQILYGVFVALSMRLLVWVYSLGIVAIDASLTALLLGNLLFFRRR